MLLLHHDLPFASVHDGVERQGSADPSVVAIEARRSANGRRNDGVVSWSGRRCGASTARPRPWPAYDAVLATSAL